MDNLLSIGSDTVERMAAVRAIVGAASTDTALVSQLGLLARDLYAATVDCRQRCLYCMGSMGSVIPLALGLATAHRCLRVLALEGDGSLLMNLGTLVSIRRYGNNRIGVIIFDNRCYESTGQQPSQPEGFAIENLCLGVGLRTRVATNVEAIRDWIQVHWPKEDSPAALVIRSRVSALASPRISEPPRVLTERFRGWVRSLPENPR
jgi:thiamine pyrophosphate-dependent acetolactate synthase large subunit-like protein